MAEASRRSVSVPLVGRERELAVLRRKLEVAARGHGSVAFLSGEPGIGKTRLAEEASSIAELGGVRVLWGRCYEGEGAPSFWPWVQIIRGFVREQDPELLRAWIGPGAADIAQIVPELRERLPDLASPPSLEPAQARFRFFDSTTAFLLRAAADQPLLLVLDDLHWADEPSLLLLQFLAHELGSAHVLTLGTYRDTDVAPGHALTRALADLARCEGTEHVPVRGLTEGEVARLLHSDGGPALPDGLARTLAHETEGNPFFITQILRLLNSGPASGRERPNSWAGLMPPSVREALGRRLERLSPACRSVLTVAAVLGRDFNLATLERVGELAGEPLLAALDEAVAARIIQPAERLLGAYAFTHALMRETIYGELSAVTRVRLHRQAGESLETIYAADPEPHLAELAYHFGRAAPGGGVERALDYARRAGDHALALLAYEDAAEQYRSAAELLNLRLPVDERRRCELLIAESEAWSRCGRAIEARRAYARAAELARSLEANDLLARTALGFGGPRPPTGVVDDEHIALLREALDRLGGDDSDLRARLLACLARALYWSKDHAAKDALSRCAVEIARRLADPETLAVVLNARHWTVRWPDMLDERLAIGAELIPLAERLGRQ